MHVMLLAALLAGTDAPPTQAWVARSNAIAQQLLQQEATVSPEGVTELGIEGFDEAITNLAPGYEDRRRALAKSEEALLVGRLASETDPQVKEDLKIMLDAVRRSGRGVDLEAQYLVPVHNVGEEVFSGIKTLLDDQIAPERRKAALVRLRKYAGLEKGSQPYASLARALTEEAMKNPKRQMPSKAEIEKDLKAGPMELEGVGKLFQKYGIAGYEPSLAELKKQAAAYDAWLKNDILPKAPADFRLPPPVYAFALEAYGVTEPPAQLAADAHAAYDGLHKEMQALATEIAKERHLPKSDFRDVLRELRKEQLTETTILPHYQKRLAEIEAIIQREHLVTLPKRECRIRLASEAESARMPAPHMDGPRLVNNHGEQGVFVLPVSNPVANGGDSRIDDFLNASASWGLAAHEARPGHELQFASMVERGVSQARAIYAFNSANVEGWGLYSESIIAPYMSKEGQLLALWMRSFRAARAFLDPELQAGRITPEQAMKFLEEDTVCSHGLASEEVDRYTFQMPGQATSYFFGYSQLRALRAEAEKQQGKSFNAGRFHDLVLAQGALPLGMLHDAVLAQLK
ncbi:MAG: DUF885 domain-containing protein [Deltaproteobacteria bacterium]|nr:DUF885 domain-containing protein [Deltaproteobacteria bacterium]